MCGRYTLTKKEHDALASRCEAKLGEKVTESVVTSDGKKHGPQGVGRFNVAPTQQVLAVVRDGEDAEREMRLLRWGLLPTWAKDLNAGYKMINAKAENLEKSPAYRPLVGKIRHRCLIVADGFYEWMKAEDPKQPRQPVRFTVDDGEPFAFAGLWTRAKLEGEWLASCTIVTTSPPGGGEPRWFRLAGRPRLAADVIADEPEHVAGGADSEHCRAEESPHR